MSKFFKTVHYISKDKQTNIYINFYTTKSGFLKFNIEVYKEILNGFCTCIARYNTSDNSLFNYLKTNDSFILMVN